MGEHPKPIREFEQNVDTSVESTPDSGILEGVRRIQVESDESDGPIIKVDGRRKEPINLNGPVGYASDKQTVRTRHEGKRRASRHNSQGRNRSRKNSKQVVNSAIKAVQESLAIEDNKKIIAQEVDLLKEQVALLNFSASGSKPDDGGDGKKPPNFTALPTDEYVAEILGVTIRWGKVGSWLGYTFVAGATSLSILGTIMSPGEFNYGTLAIPLVSGASKYLLEKNFEHVMVFDSFVDKVDVEDMRADDKTYHECKHAAAYCFVKHTKLGLIWNESKRLLVSLELLGQVASRCRNIRPDVAPLVAWEKIFTYCDSVATVNVNKYLVLDKHSIVLNTAYVAFGLFMHFRRKHVKLGIVPLN